MFIRHLLLSTAVAAMLGSMANAFPLPGLSKRAAASKSCSTVVKGTTLTSTPFYITFNGTIEGDACSSINGSSSQFTLHSFNSSDYLSAVNLDGTTTNGTSCDITIPDNRYQTITGKSVFVFVPLITADGNKTSISCGNDKPVALNVNLDSFNVPGVNVTTTTLTGETTTTREAAPTHHAQEVHHTTTTTTTTEEPHTTHHTTTHHTTTHHTTTTTTTTTTHHAAPTHHSNTDASSSDDSGAPSFSGRGTWFIPETEGGAQGACGPMESNTEMIGALNAPQYGNLNGKSSWCGKKVKVTSGDKSIIITINDACPECAHGSIDLTQAAFAKLGNLVTGVLPITWHEI